LNTNTHPFLTKLSSPVGMAIILGLFAAYALIRYFAFPMPQVPGTTDMLPILLASQFAMLVCLLVIVRAARDGRVFEGVVVAFLAIPVISIATNAALMAATGMPVTLDALKRSSILFNPVVWAGLGVQGLLLGAILLWQRRRKVQ
jgi:hypothetical protein